MLLKRLDELPKEIYNLYERNNELKCITKVTYELVECFPNYLTMTGTYRVYFETTYDQWSKINDKWNYETMKSTISKGEKDA